MFGRKQSKPKDKLKLLKRFIMGDDVRNDILNGIDPITGIRVIDTSDLSKLNAEQLNELLAIKDETERAVRVKEIIREQEGNGKTIIWLQHIESCQPPYDEPQQRFPDPEIANVSYSRIENVPVIDSKPVLPPVSKKRESIELKEPVDEMKIRLAQVHEKQAWLDQIREEWVWK